MPSTLVGRDTVVPAIVAGIEDVNVWAAAAARRLGPHGGTVGGRKGRAARVVKVRGAQAIAAFGTTSIPAVDRVIGPGNVYVTEASGS